MPKARFQNPKNKLLLAVVIAFIVVFLVWLISLKYTFRTQGDIFTFKENLNEVDQSFDNLKERWNSFWQSYQEQLNTNTSVLTNEQVERLTDKIKDLESEEQIDITNWLTYRNEEYGFEFRYPGDLQIDEGGLENDLIIKSTDDNSRIFALTVINLDLLEETDSLEETIKEDMIKDTERKIEIDGRTGIQFKSTPKVDKDYVIQKTIIKRDNKLYIYLGEGEMFNQILFIFKFLE